MAHWLVPAGAGLASGQQHSSERCSESHRHSPSLTLGNPLGCEHVADLLPSARWLVCPGKFSLQTSYKHPLPMENVTFAGQRALLLTL